MFKLNLFTRALILTVVIIGLVVIGPHGSFAVPIDLFVAAVAMWFLFFTFNNDDKSDTFVPTYSDDNDEYTSYDEDHEYYDLS